MEYYDSRISHIYTDQLLHMDFADVDNQATQDPVSYTHLVMRTQCQRTAILRSPASSLMMRAEK